jgi:hypothetical protein
MRLLTSALKRAAAPRLLLAVPKEIGEPASATGHGGPAGGRGRSSSVSDEESRPLHTEVEASRPAPAATDTTPERNAAKATGRSSPIRSMDFWLAFLGVAVVVVLLVDGLRLPALVVAVIAATALERHRQARRPRPLTLAATPRAWRHTVETTIGLRATLLSAGLLAAAWVLITHPPFGSDSTTVRAPSPVSAAAFSTRPPALPIRTYRAGQSFRIEGASFRVIFNSSTRFAANLRNSIAGRGVRWVAVEVDTTNLSRHGFDPNDLDYRLRDRSGAIYYPDVHGGTGPASLSTPGLLRPGLTAESQLGFQVPRSAGTFTLVFEPVIGGPVQVHVDLFQARGHRQARPDVRSRSQLVTTTKRGAGATAPTRRSAQQCERQPTPALTCAKDEKRASDGQAGAATTRLLFVLSRSVTRIRRCARFHVRAAVVQLGELVEEQPQMGAFLPPTPVPARAVRRQRGPGRCRCRS